MHPQVILGQSDGVALVLGAPEPWQWGVLLVHVRVELLETVHRLLLVRVRSRRGRRSVRDDVESQQSYGRRRLDRWRMSEYSVH